MFYNGFDTFWRFAFFGPDLCRWSLKHKPFPCYMYSALPGAPRGPPDGGGARASRGASRVHLECSSRVTRLSRATSGESPPRFRTESSSSTGMVDISPGPTRERATTLPGPTTPPGLAPGRQGSETPWCATGPTTPPSDAPSDAPPARHAGRRGSIPALHAGRCVPARMCTTATSSTSAPQLRQGPSDLEHVSERTEDGASQRASVTPGPCASWV